MRNIFYISTIKIAFLVVALATTIVACKKDSDGSPEMKAGTPAFGAITPAESAGGSVVTLTGSGLGQMRTIVFDKNNVPAYFQPNLNTETSLVFRVPDTAFGGNQTIIFTNVEGKELKVPFKVIALPTVTEVSNYNYNENDLLTLTGNNLDNVNKVVLTGTTTEVTIVSQSRKTMVLKMPTTTLSRSTLDITNASGKITTTQEFVYIPNNFIIYTDGWGAGAYNSGVQSWSWGVDVSEVADSVKAGTKALKADYKNGGLSLFLGSNWATPQLVFTDWMPERSFLTFWAKSVGADVDVNIVTDGPAANYTGSGSYKAAVKKGVWTYFKIPSGTFTGNYGRLNFTNSGDKTVYYDDILWVK